jgi:hypothetical protein
MLAVYGVVHKTLSEFEGETFEIQFLCQNKINRKGKDCRSKVHCQREQQINIWQDICSIKERK